MSRARSQAACDKAAVANLRPFRMVARPNLAIFDQGEFAIAREHLASLSPERRAELEGEWK